MHITDTITKQLFSQGTWFLNMNKLCHGKKTLVCTNVY